MKKLFIKILSLTLILIINNCANTRVVVEGVKTVIKDDKKEVIKKKETITTKGHYKVGQPYVINNIKYIPRLVSYYDKNGIASWYGPKFNKKPTANGEIFNQDKVSAAHKTLPLPSIVKVTNLSTNKHLFIRVNDRGPFVNDRIIDLSKQAAIELNIFLKGTEKVNVKLLDSGPHLLDSKYLNQNYLKEYANNLERKNNKDKADIKDVNFIQLGVFTIKNNALNLIEDIKNKYNNSDLSIFLSETDKNKIYKVLIGPFQNLKGAKNIADNLTKLGYTNIILNEKDNQ
ncbi:MAG: septal ring lytic transglycosylase RlpA family protein [Alphaproteobacteria bacterium TMED93]|nr:MAG: septal ring lytic transglycosylase RlpA family protein [Alphaproteobacteria bacterium TMED93]|tara:strand:- start:88 stop:948 length:861 start_codon:yes stop_codon:yes gene_type:complete